MPKFSARSEKKLIGVHPKLVDLCHAVIEDTPVDFCIVQGVRSQAYQDELYAQGRTTEEIRKAGIKGIEGKPNMQEVTGIRNSDHIPRNGFGWAVDIALGSAQNPKWIPESDFAIIIEVFKAHAERMGLTIDCGIDWKRKDSGHVALKEKK